MTADDDKATTNGQEIGARDAAAESANAEDAADTNASAPEASAARTEKPRDTDGEPPQRSGGRGRFMPSVAAALTVGIVLLLAVTVTSGWLVYQNYQSRNAEKDRQAFLQVARQGALNLTTIDWQQADADIQRILAGATGPFHDDFAQRAQPFVEVVKQAQSKSEGTITEAALESESGTEAQALVAVKVKTATAQAPEQQLRSWRMRLTVQEKDNEIKVSNVEFVP